MAKKKENAKGVWNFYIGKNTDLTFEWEKGKPKCDKCGMVHSKLKGTCTWVVFTDSNPIVQTRNIVKYPNVFFTRKDGRSALRHNIISEFINYGFPKLGITNIAVQKRIMLDLRYLAKGITAKAVDSAKARVVVKCGVQPLIHPTSFSGHFYCPKKFSIAIF